MSLAAALVGAGVLPLSTTPDASGVSPADWLAHTIGSGVEPSTGASTNRVSAGGIDLSQVDEPRRLVTGRLADYVDVLAASVEIAVSSVVTRIAYDDRRVSLRLDSGESLTVDRAIVTVPLGVLKTDTLRFSPALPLLHQRAISVLGMGVVDTVWLRFESAFWRADAPHAPGAAPDVLTVVGEPTAVGAWIDVGAPTGRPGAHGTHRCATGDSTRGTGRRVVPGGRARRSRAVRHSIRLTPTSTAVRQTKIASTSAQ